MNRNYRVPTLLALLALVGVLGGCGCGSCDDDFWGDVYVDNLTDASTVEYVDFFETARFGEPWTGNLLVQPLPPGFVEFIGTYYEDYYDAFVELELGDVVEWFDVFVGYGENVYFEIY